MLNLLLLPQIDKLFLYSENREEQTHRIDLLDNICQSFKELIANIEPNNDIQLRTEYFISVILEAKIIPYVVGQVVRSRLCNPVVKDKEKDKEKLDLSSSVELTTQSPVSDPNPSFNTPLFLSQGKISSYKEEIILSDDYD